MKTEKEKRLNGFWKGTEGVFYEYIPFNIVLKFTRHLKPKND